MTARKPNAEDRITQAYSRLLASVRITPEMPHAVQDALVREADFIESHVLARLIGRLSGTVCTGQPLSASRLAQVIEDMCALGEKDAADLIAKSTPKETDR